MSCNSAVAVRPQEQKMSDCKGLTKEMVFLKGEYARPAHARLLPDGTGSYFTLGTCLLL